MFAMWLFFDTGNADAPEKLDQHLRYLSSDLNYYFAAVYLLIGAGVIIIVAGFFGWLGAYRESTCMLMTVCTHTATSWKLNSSKHCQLSW